MPIQTSVIMLFSFIPCAKHGLVVTRAKILQSCCRCIGGSEDVTRRTKQLSRETLDIKLYNRIEGIEVGRQRVWVNGTKDKPSETVNILEAARVSAVRAGCRAS